MSEGKGPGFHFLWLGHAYFGLEQYENAIAEYKKALDRQPDYIFAHILLAASYGLTGREEEARDAAAAVLRIDPKFSVDNFAKRLVYKDQDYKGHIVEGLGRAGLK